MKYTIEGLSQEKLVEMKLDNTDALIIRWFLDFKATDKMVKIINNNVEYFWVKYESVRNEFPLLNIKNNESIARRFNKYRNVGIMVRHIEKNPNGTFSCWNTTDKILELIYTHPTQKSTAIDAKVDPPPDAKVDTKDPSININPSTNIILEESKNYSLTLEKEIFKYIIDGFYNYYNKEYDITGKERGSAKRIAKKLIKYEDWEEILKKQFLNMLRKKKENPKFWAITISKLEWGWNELLEMTLENSASKIQTEEIIKELQEKKYAVK